MSGTVLVKSPVIPQGGNITVTAPSVTNIPSGFYDGTETITANSGSSLPSSSEFNTKVVAVSGENSPNDIGFIYGLHQDASYIYLCGGSMIMDGSSNVVNHCVTRYNKTTYAIDRYEFPENSAGGRNIGGGVGLGVDGNNIHFFATNVPGGYSGVYFDTTTQTFTAYSTILSPFSGTTIAGTGTRVNAPGATLFENGYNSNTIVFGSYTIQGIFRFRYNSAASATPRKYVAGEGYISNANVGYVGVEYSGNTSMNVFGGFEAGRYSNSSNGFGTSPVDGVIYDDGTYIYILHCSAIFGTLSGPDYQITGALHCIRVDKTSGVTNIYSSKQFFTGAGSSSTGNNRLFYISGGVISVYSQTSSSYESLCELDLSTMLFTQGGATGSGEPRFNKQLGGMLTDALGTLGSGSPVGTQIVTTSGVAGGSTYTLISISGQNGRGFSYTRGANKTP